MSRSAQKTAIQVMPVFDPAIQVYLRANNPADNNPLTSVPPPTRGIRYALAQPSSMVARKNSIQEAIEYNFSVLSKAVEIASSFGTQLISFPELFLSGYEFGEMIEGKPDATIIQLVDDTAQFLNEKGYWAVGGPISQLASQTGMAIICPGPYKGLDAVGNHGVFDSAHIFDRDGSLLGIYYKTHLWGFSERNWFNVPYFASGLDGCRQAFPVFQINDFPVGIAICYDAEFPEVARCLSLNGALLMAMPTAAPNVMLSGQTEPYPDVSEHFISASALVNQNFCSYGNRSRY